MEWNHFLSKLLALSKVGLKFSKDPYALENYQELHDLVILQSEEVDQKIDSIKLYPKDAYPTPNVSVRVIIFNDKKELLMVKERSDEKYAVPGGWCDVFESARENAIKEVKQETNLDVSLVRLLGVLQRDLYKPKPSMVSEYVLYFLAKVEGGRLAYNHELMDIGYFALDALPPLSFKSTEIELRRMLDVAINWKDVDFD